MTITSEVANVAAGIAFLIGHTPLTVVLVTSENLGGSAVPPILLGQEKMR